MKEDEPDEKMFFFSFWGRENGEKTTESVARCLQNNNNDREKTKETHKPYSHSHQPGSLKLTWAKSLGAELTLAEHATEYAAKAKGLDSEGDGAIVIEAKAKVQRVSPGKHPIPRHQSCRHNEKN